MAIGMKVWDGAGNLVVDVGDGLTRVLGTIFVAQGTTGVVTDDGFLTGTPWCSRMVSNPALQYLVTAQFPTRISFAGNQMHWDNTLPSGDHRLVYGVSAV